VRVVKRHNGGGNLLHFDGSVFLAKDPQHVRLDYWEPDYKNWSPGW